MLSKSSFLDINQNFNQYRMYIIVSYCFLRIWARRNGLDIKNRQCMGWKPSALPVMEYKCLARFSLEAGGAWLLLRVVRRPWRE